ncbi:mannitol-1-phosphate 5-dehydrogenase [Spiroplasma sabaudiense Ar-1343]|uniref:Mannitol-1-phosphate 5-dehydrogenase n=1 Tax=Spiroplasma sabaudiense Ar-1343 TaxID=1276257 RepID=W6AKL5_9MOLU|nr:hypothetical protein [Spiroplasma sabaudiense]AHI54259.1 mannitol-1-phosphate 5-dehydrogenase [Spiroplasma sabaudiense Ar-1343]
MKAIHFGAGNIGRGFIAPILFQDKAIEKLLFIDVNQEIVDQINLQKKYEVIEMGTKINNIEIKNISAITTKEILNSDIENNFEDYSILTISIGQNNLKYIIPQILKIIKSRKNPLVIMCCENGYKVSSYFKTLISQQTENLKNIFFVDCVVDRIVPNSVQKGLDVSVEKYFSWVANVEQWPDTIKKLSSVAYSNNIDGEINKKICLLNGAHASIGWYRWQVDKFKVPFLKEALENNETLKFIENYLQEVGKIISFKYNFEIKEVKKYCEKVLKRFSNPYLVDNLERICRNPIQKIQLKERILGPLTFAIENNLAHNFLKKTFENALLYLNPKDIESQKLIELWKKFSKAEIISKVIQDIPNELIKKII